MKLTGEVGYNVEGCGTGFTGSWGLDADIVLTIKAKIIFNDVEYNVTLNPITLFDN